jgi:hypothetical protein
LAAVVTMVRVLLTDRTDDTDQKLLCVAYSHRPRQQAR